jgi:hypothetical protein
MLIFKTLDIIKDKHINEFLVNQDFRTCDYTACSIYMWQDYYKCEYTIDENMLFIKNQLKDGSIAFSFPIGSGDLNKAFDKIEEYAKYYKIDLHYGFVPYEGLLELQNYYHERLTYTTTIDNSDYLYKTEDLIKLEGASYKNQRNRINKFVRTYGDYDYHVIDKESIPLIKKYFAEYIIEHIDKGEMYDVENAKTLDVLNHYQQFNLQGGYLTLSGEIIGFAIGEVVKDTMYLHIEKALARISGAYQLLNNEFLVNTASPEIIYVNLEEDVGDAGLRMAKQSYKPIKMLDKYNISIVY